MFYVPGLYPNEFIISLALCAVFKCSISDLLAEKNLTNQQQQQQQQTNKQKNKRGTKVKLSRSTCTIVIAKIISTEVTLLITNSTFDISADYTLLVYKISNTILNCLLAQNFSSYFSFCLIKFCFTVLAWRMSIRTRSTFYFP